MARLGRTLHSYLQQRLLDIDMNNRNIFTSYKGTRRLREIRDAALIKLSETRDKRYIAIDSVTLHFFENCCLVYGKYELGRIYWTEKEMTTKSFAVYSKDLKTWHSYTDQFEPKEGYHKAYEYKPHDEPFPTREW